MPYTCFLGNSWKPSPAVPPSPWRPSAARWAQPSSPFRSGQTGGLSAGALVRWWRFRSLASSGRPRRLVVASGLQSHGPWPCDCGGVAFWLPLNRFSIRFVAEAQVNIYFPDSSLCRPAVAVLAAVFRRSSALPARLFAAFRGLALSASARWALVLLPLPSVVGKCMVQTALISTGTTWFIRLVH